MREPRPQPDSQSSIYSRQLAGVMTPEEMTLFEWIFEDAYLVDVDCPSWAEFIALYLVAPHAVEHAAGGSWPLFIVEFLRVRRWDLAFNHLNHEPAAESGPHEPTVWRINYVAVQAVEGGLPFDLWGAAEHPSLTVTRASANIREIPSEIPDRLFPGRLTPPCRFIRLGLDELACDREGGASTRQPDHDGGDDHHSAIGDGVLLVARGQPAPRFQPRDRTKPRCVQPQMSCPG